MTTLDTRPLHELWGLAKDAPGYDKAKWMELSNKFETALRAVTEKAGRIESLEAERDKYRALYHEQNNKALEFGNELAGLEVELELKEAALEKARHVIECGRAIDALPPHPDELLAEFKAMDDQKKLSAMFKMRREVTVWHDAVHKAVEELKLKDAALEKADAVRRVGAHVPELVDAWREYDIIRARTKEQKPCAGYGRIDPKEFFSDKSAKATVAATIGQEMARWVDLLFDARDWKATSRKNVKPPRG